jgi:hypothetical protein
VKITLTLLLACAALLAVVGVPASWDRFSLEGEQPETALAGVLLDVNVQSSNPCRLVVQSVEQTVVDRGAVSTLETRHEFTGTFRYWEEPAGRALYVYDDAQSLVGRVLNPHSVTLVDPVE